MNPRPALSDGLILVLGLAVLLNYVDRANLATAAPLLQDELSLSSAQIGVLLSSFFWVYAPAQILAGWLVHRFDIRIVLAAGLALWGVATAATGLAVGFASILVLRLILGLGESVLFPGYQLILSRHTAEHERGRANGFIGAGQGAGPMLGTLFGGLAMARFGWRAMFVGLGLTTLLWLWPWFVATRGRSFESSAAHSSVSIPYPAILRRREFWGAALGHFSINYAFYFVITWLPTFLIKAGGFTVSQMAGIGAAIYGVYAVATALAGVLSDRWIGQGASTTLVRKTFALTSAVGAAVTIAGSALVEPRSAVWLLAAAGVCFGLSTPTMFAMTGTLAGPRAAGRWAGAQNVFGQLAGIIAPIVTGLIVDRTGAFSWAFAIAAVSAILALVAWGIVIRRVETVAWPSELTTVSRNEAAPFKSAAARDAYLARHKERSARWPEPWTEQLVPTAFGQTYVRVSGREGAPSLVMLPGVGSPGYSLAPQAFGFAPHFRVYAVDNIYDVGRSIPSKPLVSADDFAAWLDSLFDALALSKPNVLGLSYGGWIVAQYAFRRPERLNKLVLLAPAGTLAPLPFGFVWRALLTLLPGKKKAMDRFVDWASPGMAGSAEWVEERRALIDDATLSQVSFAKRRLVPPIPPKDEVWSKLAVPTLLMFGDREVIFDPAAAADRIKALAPQIQLEVLPGVSHDFFVVAADQVNARVLHFLSEVGEHLK